MWLLLNYDILYKGLKFIKNSKEATMKEIIAVTDERTFQYLSFQKLIKFTGDWNNPPHCTENGLVKLFDNDTYELSDAGLDLYFEFRREYRDKLESRFWKLVPILVSLAALAVSVYALSKSTEHKVIIEVTNASSDTIKGIQSSNSSPNKN